MRLLRFSDVHLLHSIIHYPLNHYPLIKFRIKENSWVAKIAAKKLKAAGGVAIVVGKTIHLHHTTKENFLADEEWVKHELCHIGQFRRYGFFNFIFKYLVESYRNGYHNNKYEVEAREAENK